MTHFRLAERTASELYVRDVARLLHAGGTQVAVFASRVGAVGEGLRQDGIEVATHPRVSFKPELIHGQGNLEAMAAILAHPGVPAVFLTHGAGPWRELPPRHPRIHRYLGLTQAARTWLQRARGIAREQVEAVPDLIDEAAIGEARRVPVKPGTALHCDFVPAPGREGRVLRRACEEAGIRLDAVSELAGKASLRLKDLFACYDLVFASGKTVIEALAAGCGVIPVSQGSVGELVTVENFERLSAADFPAGGEPKAEPVLVAELAAEIDRWDWRNLSPLAAKVRGLHGAVAVAARLREIYETVLAEAAVQRAPCRRELPAVADWLLELAGQHHQLDQGYLELQHRASLMQRDRGRSDAEAASLLAQLEAEKEKVRLARRLLQDGSILRQRLKRRIEEGWEEIENRQRPARSRPGASAEEPAVDLCG